MIHIWWDALNKLKEKLLRWKLDEVKFSAREVIFLDQLRMRKIPKGR